jgi:hypothetical protein
MRTTTFSADRIEAVTAVFDLARARNTVAVYAGRLSSTLEAVVFVANVLL